MAKADKTIAGMRTNPQGWTIADVERVCAEVGLVCKPPKRGSHYKISHPALPEILTVPFKRPIKPVYIRELLRMIERLEKAK
jgi:predicted RNA binding protein YcfA (HicA-like mRNA interferase family)